MKRKEFIKEVSNKIKPNAEIVFYATMEDKNGKHILLELSVDEINMTVDVDDPNVGGIVFNAKEI